MMSFQKALQGISLEQLFDTMSADASNFETAPDTHISFADFLINNYPSIFQFADKATEAMPFDAEEEYTAFMLGACFMAAALCRNVERLDLPSIE